VYVRVLPVVYVDLGEHAPLRPAFAIGLAALVLAAPAGAAHAEEIGACLTTAGLRLAPWSDAFEPACGEDCGEDGVLVEDETTVAACGDAEGACGDDSADILSFLPAPRPTAAELEPAPSGPRCLEGDATCSPGAPTGAGLAAGADVLPEPLLLARGPRRGTLPGATVAWPERVLIGTSLVPDPPPPRA
jgi:hypothetical protein